MPLDPIIARGVTLPDPANAIAIRSELDNRRQYNALLERRMDAGDRQYADTQAKAQEEQEMRMLYPAVKAGDQRAVALVRERLAKRNPQLAEAVSDPALLAQMMEQGLGITPEKAPGPITMQRMPDGTTFYVQDGKRIDSRMPPAPQQQAQGTWSAPFDGIGADGKPGKFTQHSITGDVKPVSVGGTPLAPPPKVDREGQKTEIQLASTFANQSKDFNTVSGQYRRVLAVSKNPSPANDFALIYAFAKIQDPTSVVRESEFTQAAKTGAYGDQVQAAIGRVTNGKTLTDRQRYDFVNAARNAYEAQRQQWESSVVAPAKQQADAYGLDWNNIYKDYTVKESQPPAGGTSKSGKSFQHRSGATVEILD